MKKIRKIKDFRTERLKLRIRELELEREIQSSWKKIKGKFSAEENSTENKRARKNVHYADNSLLNVVLNYSAVKISHKLGMLAGNKVEYLMSQICENLFRRLDIAIRKTVEGKSS